MKQTIHSAEVTVTLYVYVFVCVTARYAASDKYTLVSSESRQMANYMKNPLFKKVSTFCVKVSRT